MDRHQIGEVRDLLRYPVKSMQGERLGTAQITDKGVLGDRVYAIRETNGRIVSAKKWPTMLAFGARYLAPESGAREILLITLPDGQVVEGDARDIDGVLSSALGRSVTLDGERSGGPTQFEIDPSTVFADVPIGDVLPGRDLASIPDAIESPVGTFFDSAHIHIIASGTLSHMAKLIGTDAQLDPRRFRPNIVIDTGTTNEGFMEDEWLGGVIEVGDSARIVQMRPTLRCAMTTHQQAGLVRDIRILRTVAQCHQAHAGASGSIGAAGSVRIGDPVFLCK